MASDVISILRERGLIHQVTDEEGLRKAFSSGVVTVYVGFDPTAKSLHIGSLLPILVLCHVQRAGHRPVALVGGATGMVGDPSGRSSERTLQTMEQVRENCEGIRGQLSRFLRFDGPNAALLVNNADWIAPMSAIDWLRDVGKHFSVNAMLAKESVRARLEDREHGISYTEFSYMLMQAYDFYHLFGAHACRVQGGGSDQWGNITAGIDLIRRKCSGEAMGFTWPLVTTSGGEKFGKSAGNAIWIDAELCSPYDFYQYFVRSHDADVERYLKFFTFLQIGEISAIMASHQKDPGKREAQKVLAREVTALVHGAPAAEEAARTAAALFGGAVSGADGVRAKIAGLGSSAPTKEISRSLFDQGPVTALNFLAATGVVASKGEGRRLIDQKGVSINEALVEGHADPVTLGTFIDGAVLVRLGKAKYTKVVLK